MRKLFLFIFITMLVTLFVACDKGDDDESRRYKGEVIGGHECADLGLSSGTLWSTCNVGAINPWDYGDYYAWGETQTKTDYDWDNYKYVINDSNLDKIKNWYIIKYNIDEGKGSVDNKIILDNSDDVATTIFGSDYSMPTVEDWLELYRGCYWVWTDNYNNQNVIGYIIYRAKSNDDKGIKVYKEQTPSASYSLSDAHIFLPSAGYQYKTSRNLWHGAYWSSTLWCPYGYDHWSDGAQCLFFDALRTTPVHYTSRCEGLTIRPVLRPTHQH